MVLVHFYIILWTNILIQCPVPVLVFCMFFVSQKNHTKQSPNAIKIYGDFLWKERDPGSFGREPEDPQGGHKLKGRPPRGMPCRLVGPSGLPPDVIPTLEIPIYSKTPES